jgi:hypothetical protein
MIRVRMRVTMMRVTMVSGVTNEDSDDDDEHETDETSVHDRKHWVQVQALSM